MSTLDSPAFVINFLASYFGALHLNYVTVFNCWNPEDNHHLMGHLSAAVRFVKVVDLSSGEGGSLEIGRGNRSRVGMFLEYGCPRSRELLDVCAEARCFSTSVHWVMMNGSVLDALGDVDLYVDAEIKVLVEDGDDQLKLYDVYNNGKSLGGTLNVTFDRVVNVLPSGEIRFGRSIVDQKSKYLNRNNLSDITLRIGTISRKFPSADASVGDVLRFLESYEERNVDTVVRIGYMLTQALQRDLNFEIQYTHYDSTTDNVIGAILDNRIDLSMSGTRAPNERMEHLTSVLYYMNYELAFIFKTPTSDSLLDSPFFRPFAPETWFAIFLTILVGSIVIKINHSLEARYQEYSLDWTGPPWFSAFVESLGHFCQQGAHLVARNLLGRLIQLVIMTCALVVYNYYSSVIFLTLIASPLMSDIRTLSKLADSRLQLGVEDTIEARDYFLNSHTTHEASYLARKKFTDHTWTRRDIGLERVRHGDYAYHCEKTDAFGWIRQNFDLQEVCDLNVLESKPPQPIGFLVRKDSPFRELFTLRFARMKELGIVRRFTEFWITKKPECFSESVVSSVSFEGSFALFLLLIAGIVVALGAFTVEIGLFREIWARINPEKHFIYKVT
ncbi:ionotropic receptor 75a-like [Culex pipiens pallens]|uniref:ionotropic receptor 75a-like n=1 Tax=Culex pipiens pallens TaxID=42434 RepID=UPI0019546984|nr:ionotropic receptor 75a-like [Culex pipiens pallens]